MRPGALRSATWRPKGALDFPNSQRIHFPMQIRFADRRPDGDYALVLPLAGKDWNSLDSLEGDRALLPRGRKR